MGLKTKSLQSGHKKILGVISPEKAESLLVDWVNLPDRLSDKSFLGYSRMVHRYPEVFILEKDGQQLKKAWEKQTYRILQTGQKVLKKVWRSPDTRRRDWYLFVLRGLYQDSCVRVADPLHDKFIAMSRTNDLIKGPPIVTPVEAALTYLQTHLAYRMLICANSTCPAPFFFKTKKVQKYCSPECADPARRESKRRWWNKNRGKDMTS